MNTRQPTQRRRRAVEAIEFALILPIFLVVIFAIIEFSWYMFQRGAMVDVARRSCQAAASLDPQIQDFETAAIDLIFEELRNGGKGAGIDCDEVGRVCNITVTDLSGAFPPRVQCEVAVNFKSLSGFLPSAGWLNAIPDRVKGASVAVFEEAD